MVRAEHGIRDGEIRHEPRRARPRRRASRPKRIAVNALWPRTTIATSAIKKFRGDAVMRASRTPDILADAAHMIFLKDVKTFTGNFLIDDTFLFANGVRGFDRYRVDPGVDLEPDFFVPDDPPPVSMKESGRLISGLSPRRSRCLLSYYAPKPDGSVEPIKFDPRAGGRQGGERQSRPYVVIH